jgi:lysophospholipase L1-like esterase
MEPRFSSQGAVRHGLMLVAVVLGASGLPAVAVAGETKRHHTLDDSALNREPRTVLLGIGDSLTHGTMDATNNDVNTLNAYLQVIADSLGQTGVSLWFKQPLFNDKEHRVRPFLIPTNVAVDGADAFSVEGLAYYLRAGTDESLINPSYICDKLLPSRLESTYDKVLYPINVRAGQDVTQMDALIWNLSRLADAPVDHRALVIFWVGNNDSSNAALGGGFGPMQMPIPADLVEPEVTWAMRTLLRVGQETGEVAFEPYTIASIEKHLTTPEDFAAQYDHLIDRIFAESALPTERMELFLLTLPYYSAVGHLFDSEDLEFYLQQLDPTYTVPPTFARVAPPGEPIVNPLGGDRVSILTFGMMYTLLWSGHSVEYVNRALEIDGQQRDGLVMSQAEQEYISGRIDAFNDAIDAVAAKHPNGVHLVDVGQYLNDGLGGNLMITVGDKVLGRKWVRGSGFTLDGVHPGYTAQALIAGFVLEAMNAVTALDAPLPDIDAVFATDPYIDHDGDGWAPGPDYRPFGITELLFMLTDPDDADATVRAALPDNVWRMISNALVRDLVEIPSLRLEAQRLGIMPDPP